MTQARSYTLKWCSMPEKGQKINMKALFENGQKSILRKMPSIKIYDKMVLPGFKRDHRTIERHANLIPKLFLRGRKDSGRSWLRDAYKIDCLRGYGRSIKLLMLPLPDFTLRLQGVNVLYN